MPRSTKSLTPFRGAKKKFKQAQAGQARKISSEYDDVSMGSYYPKITNSTNSTTFGLESSPMLSYRTSPCMKRKLGIFDVHENELSSCIAPVQSSSTPITNMDLPSTGLYGNSIKFSQNGKAEHTWDCQTFL
ncbi:hypothetical protein N7504_006290 [Penicillium tannophilum]|nr:hypothetical protein N7504_006290 [Penicillium tannophilum]